MRDSAFHPGSLWRAMTWADRLLCVLVPVLAFGAAASARTGGDGPAEALVSVRDAVVLRLPLANDATHTVSGALGPVEVTVRDGAVRVVESGCPHRLCVKMGERRSAGGLLACVPNALLVHVVGGAVDPDAPDAVSR